MSNRDLKTLLARYGSQLIVIIVALAALLIGRGSLVSALNGSAGDPAPVAAVPATTAAGSAAEPVTAAAESAAAIPESPAIDLSAVPVITDTTVSPALDPVTFQGRLPEHEFVRYVVERGDTPNAIADKFGIKPETLLGGNEFLASESSLLQTGVELIILPIDGVLHDVLPGDTLEGLAAKYDVPIDDIIAYAPNQLAFPYRLYPGTQIVVPGAVRELFVWTPPQLSSNSSGTAFWASQSQALVVGTGTFVWPVGSRNFTQYFWYGHQAIDVGVPDGTPIYATDTGTVTYATWSSYCFGNLIVVNHGNGYESFYAHLSGFNVVAGQIVRQGQLIGWSGNTGCSSGPHLHFEIRVYGNRDDPCWYLPGGCF